jgi:5-methylcytosine-specific restriction endonuclease McrA
VYRHPRWRKLRKAILVAEPMCRAGCGRHATDIDHADRLVTLIASGRDPFDVALLAPLCSPCHARKTMWEQGRLPAPSWLSRIRGIPIATQ